ncbi:hypothetical protein GCK72_020728 [Caenorhabditis remanei]|uniref:Nuclear receptor domain-containing protein n=1 Tax=Caenorhabditis remanei TaxID=31234 RepID=A0A6A5GG25_CAERE|nr:hypothetical protein GCK72_020728 [Caenorhabditis remanei]KAF1754168.1 hypothetical protein GCK72_020728 [Caenorhabditis remanei]
MSLSPSTTVSTPSSTPSEVCAVCSDTVHSHQFGVPACLGCIVFFRRTVINKVQYKCWKQGRCLITFASRCSCRACRLRKCFHVGMKPAAIQQRDRLGPRNPKVIFYEQMIHYKDVPTSSSLFTPLVHLQRVQRALHVNYSNHPIRNRNQPNAHRKPASRGDINCSLKLAFKNADEWGNHFETYRKLSREEKNSVLSEYGIAFLLIDQAFQTSRFKKDNVWILQNGKILNSDKFQEDEEQSSKAETNSAFIEELIECLGNPFRNLEIDDFECASLKTMLLLTR